MSKFAAAVVALMSAISFAAGPAAAQNTRSFVSGHGNNGNNCALATPCRTIAAAIAATAAGGMIEVLDVAGYGSFTVDKSISIYGHGMAAIAVPSGGTGIKVQIASSDTVNLAGFNIDGLGATVGIDFTGSGTLNVRDSVVRGFANGIYLRPNANAVFNISHTVVSRNDIGLNLSPSGGFTFAYLERMTFAENADTGLRVDGTNATGSNNIRVTVADSAAHRNPNGFFVTATASSSQPNLTVVNCKMTSNDFGVSTDFGVVTLSQTTLAGNGAGYAISFGGTGLIKSFGNNYFDDNASNQGSLTPVTPQ